MAEAALRFPRLAVGGASGPTGLQVVQQALGKGHSVTAVVRSLDKFKLRPHIRFSRMVYRHAHESGFALEWKTYPRFGNGVFGVKCSGQGKNAVMSCLGFHWGTFFSPTTLCSKSITAIITAMERTGIERLVCMTGIYTQKDPANPRWVELLRPLARSFVYDMALMENTIMNSHVRYTIVRPPILTKGPETDNYVVTKGQSVPKVTSSVSRADVAHFMLKSLQINEWDKKCVAIYS